MESYTGPEETANKASGRIEKHPVFSRTTIRIVCIIILCIAVYSNTFNSPFIFDDETYIQGNPALKDFSYFTSSAKADLLPNSLGTLKEQFRNRIIGHFSFALNYWINGFDVRGYHLVNLLIHLLNSLLVYLLMILTFRTPFLKDRTASDPSFNAETPKMLAFLCALLFAVHPIQTAAVTYITQRFTSLVTLFYLLSLAFYIKARLSERSPHRYACFFISLFSAVLAMKTKEISFTLPVIVCLYEFMFMRGRLIKRIVYLSPFLLTLAIIPLTLLYPGTPDSMIKDVSEVSQETADISRPDYLFTQFSVIATYIRLLILPVGQNLDYDYPVYSSFFIPQVWVPFLFLLSVFILAVYLLYRSRRETARSWGFRFISFGLLYFFTALSVESSLIPIKDVIFEHRVYLPSFGFFVCITVSIMLIKTRMPGQFNRALLPAFLIVIMILAGAAYARNAVWGSSLSLWEDVVKKSPLKARPHNNLGNAYFSAGDIDSAINEYQSAINLQPDDEEAHYNMGIVYLRRNLLDEAAGEFRASIEANPDSDDAHLNLGIALYRQNRFAKAHAEFLNALEINPSNIEAHNNLAIYYNTQGKPAEAINEYLTMAALDPDNAEPYKDLGFIYNKLNRSDDAIGAYLTAARLNPADAGTRFGLGMCYLKKKAFNDALQQFNAALAIAPDYAEARKYADYLSRR